MTGVDRSVVVVSPSWPDELRPQQYAVPETTAHVCPRPVATSVGVPEGRPSTGTGVVRDVVVPSPICPQEFAPQQTTSSLEVIAQLCCSPESIARALRQPADLHSHPHRSPQDVQWSRPPSAESTEEDKAARSQPAARGKAKSPPVGRKGAERRRRAKDSAAAESSPSLPRKKRGRPRGAGFAERKGTRWRRADGEEMRARSFHLPVRLDKELRKRAAEEDKPIGSVIVDALEAFLG